MLRIGSIVWGVRDVPGAIRFWSAALDYRPRHHLDLYAENAGAEVERLLTLGATRAAWRYPPGADDVVLADPDGNTFCVIEKPLA
jgi:hypothetical protein